MSALRHNLSEMKKHSQSLKKTGARGQVLPALSQKHEKAEHSRKVIAINQAIRSIMWMGVMEKMELIAINNRSMFNHNKVQRAEWMARKLSVHPSLEPNPKDIRLDARKHAPLQKRRKKFAKPLSPEPRRTITEADRTLVQRYIDEYLHTLDEQSGLELLNDKQSLVEEACRQIQRRMDTHDSSPPVPAQRLHTQSLQTKSKEESQSNPKRKMRSVTQFEYNEQICRINRVSEFSSKLRARNEKMFLRRIKQLRPLTLAHSPNRQERN